MIFLKIFAYIFYAYGLTTIMVYGRGPFGLCEIIRNLAARISDGLGQLFSCPLCFSTWVGMVTSLIDVLFIKSSAFTPFGMILSSFVGGFWGALLIILMDAFATAGFVWLIHQLEEALERHGTYYSEEMVEVDENDEQ